MGQLRPFSGRVGGEGGLESGLFLGSEEGREVVKRGGEGGEFVGLEAGGFGSCGWRSVCHERWRAGLGDEEGVGAWWVSGRRFKMRQYFEMRSAKNDNV